MTKAIMPVSIRPLESADETAWRALWTAYLKFYKTTLPATTYDATFARLLDPNCTDLNAFVADQDGTLIGLTHYIFHRHCWHTGDVCYLQDLYVAPEARGTGCGRKLITAVYDAADVAGSSGVYWMTQDDNAAGRQLYDRIGKLTNFIKYQRPVS